MLESEKDEEKQMKNLDKEEILDFDFEINNKEKTDINIKQRDIDNIFVNGQAFDLNQDGDHSEKQDATNIVSQGQDQDIEIKKHDDLIISGRQPVISNAFKHFGESKDQFDEPDDISSFQSSVRNR